MLSGHRESSGLSGLERMFFAGITRERYLTDVLQRLANGEDPATLTSRSWKAQRTAVTVA